MNFGRRLLENGPLPIAHWLSEARQTLRMQLGVRAQVVATRAELVTTIRGLLRARGADLPSSATTSFLEVLGLQRMDDQTRALIEPLRRCLAAIDQQVGELDEMLRAQCVQDTEVVRLATAPGVGVVVAAFISVIDRPSRFRNAH